MILIPMHGWNGIFIMYTGRTGHNGYRVDRILIHVHMCNEAGWTQGCHYIKSNAHVQWVTMALGQASIFTMELASIYKWLIIKMCW